MSTIISAEIFHGTLPLTLESDLAETAAGELDTLEVSVLVAATSWKASLTAAGYTKGALVTGYHSMWVEETRRGSATLAAAEVSVRCLGLAVDSDKRRRRTSVAGQVVGVGPIEKTVIVWQADETGEDPATGTALDKVPRRVPKLDDEGEPEYKIIATPSGSGDRWNIRQAIVEVQDTYFVTSAPDLTEIGGAITPPDAPAVPANPWSGYTEEMRLQHPNGWVLDNRQVDELFNDGTNGLWAVTDTSGYYYPALPD